MTAALVAQPGQLMAAAGEGVKNKQPSVTVGACRELDALLGLGFS